MNIFYYESKLKKNSGGGWGRGATVSDFFYKESKSKNKIINN